MQCTLPSLVLAMPLVCGWPQPAEAAAEGVYGWWKGIVVEPKAGKADARYPATMQAFGTKGTIDYPWQRCGGELQLLESKEGRSLYRERITYGRERCADQGLVTVSRVDVDSLRWQWSGQGMTARALFFGPFDLMRAEFEPPYIEQKAAGGDLLPGEVMLHLRETFPACGVPTHYAIAMMRNFLDQNFGNRMLHMLMEPGAGTTSGDPTNNDYRVLANFLNEPGNGVFVSGDVAGVRLARARVELPASALGADGKADGQRRTFDALASFVLLTMGLADWREGGAWVDANLGRSVHTHVGNCVVRLEVQPRDPARSQLTPVVLQVSREAAQAN